MEGLTWQIWVAVGLILSLLEIITSGFFILLFGIASLAPAAVSFLGGGLIAQLLAFAIASFLLVAFVRPLLEPAFAKEALKTNVDALVGRSAVVIDEVKPQREFGLVRVEGERWSAWTEGREAITEGTKVRILAVEGVRLQVEPFDDAIGETKED